MPELRLMSKQPWHSKAASAARQEEEEEDEEVEKHSNNHPRLNEGIATAEEETKVAKEDEHREPSYENKK